MERGLKKEIPDKHMKAVVRAANQCIQHRSRVDLHFSTPRCIVIGAGGVPCNIRL